MSLWVGNAGGRLRRNKFSIKPRLVFGTAGSTTNRRVPHPLRSWQRVGYATVCIEIRGIPPFAKKEREGWGTRGFVALSAEDKKCPVSYPAGRQRRWTTLRKAAHAALFGATLQEIRVRSGRDDKFFVGNQ
jgi:hypothetical protein